MRKVARAVGGVMLIIAAGLWGSGFLGSQLIQMGLEHFAGSVPAEQVVSN